MLANQKLPITLVILLAILPLFAGSLAGKNVLVAKKVTTPPKVDGKSDKVWRKVKRVKIDFPGKFTLKAKAIYTDTHIYFLFQWPDKYKSLNRVYTYKKGRWVKKKGNEDGFNILWNIDDSIRNFNQKGCQIACHQSKDSDEESMNTNRPGERGDLWIWSAQRTDPAGYADDQYIIERVKRIGHHTTGRRADANQGDGYTSNWNKNKKRPIYTFSKGKGGTVLLKTKAKKVTRATRFSKGMTIPREVVQRPRGSQGDVSAKGVWKKKRWTLELGRKLNTGHKDDIQFTERNKPYYFGISIHNNAGGDTHATSKVVELRFK